MDSLSDTPTLGRQEHNVMQLVSFPEVDHRLEMILLLAFFLFYGWVSIFVFPKVLFAVFPSTGGKSVSRALKNEVAQTASLQNTPTEAPTATPTTFLPSLVPITIIIPKINISTTIEHVGQTKSLNIDVPKNASNVAWYVYGAKPGEEGNAIINGHYDTPSGRPAVFYYLRALEKGDEIEVVSEDGTHSFFVVTGKESIPVNTFPSEYVFFKKPGVNLNLITCGGVWDPVKKNYSNRWVIYSSKKV